MPLLFGYLKRHKKTLALALVLASINQIFSLLDPQIFRLLIDNYATKVGELSRSEFLHGVILLLLAAVGAALVSRIAKSFQGYYSSAVTQRVGTELYAHSVSHSFSLPYAVFEDQRSGELLQKLQKARIDSQALILSFIDIIFISFVGITFVLVYAFFVHWLVGFLYILTIPVLGGAMFFLGRKIKAIQKNIVRESANLAGSTTETLRNVELVKSLGLERQETRRLNAVNDQVLSLELSKIRLVRKLMFTQGTLVNGMRSAIMLAMLWLIAGGAMSLGEFFSLLFYSFFIFGPLGEMGTIAAQYQEAKGSMETLEKILEIRPEEKPEHPVVIPALESLTFKKAGFEYQEGNVVALKDMNLEIKKGETVAFVGYSGSGKTTFVKLLVGLYRPTKGQLLLNGTDASTIDYDAFTDFSHLG